MKLLILFLSALQLSAGMLLSPQEILKSNFGSDATIIEKNIILKKAQKQAVQKAAQQKLNSSIVRTYKVSKGSEHLAYAILLSNKIRSKNGVYLYTINAQDVLESIEVVAFNEPLEYMPNDTWKKQFANTDTTQHLNIPKNISTITGATLSARSITESANVAMQIYNVVLKAQK
ncbi:FMN-binding protein [Sulfurimonas microaerophilic]|uniref:FMN-binding protein n=1 Tax=Sulfurimonas microaerophilic TaxID=3058392 RepID=UPI002714B964|nr:FMN-binding protein [Sulfurimonas sp. hsl 1-7]